MRFCVSASRWPLCCALASVVSLSACHGASVTYASSGDAGTADSGSAGSADVGGSTSGGGNGGSGGGGESGDSAVAASDTPEWPIPNAPGLGLPNPESYDDASTPGLVHDRVTGLDWLQNPGTELYSRPDANSLCAALGLGGFDDWRVPTFIELVTLFDAVPGQDSALEPTYVSPVFQAGGAYWSTSAAPAHPELGRMLDFAAHNCGSGAVCSIGEAADPSRALGGAFCVRSQKPLAGAARYGIASDHITDSRTGLVWLVLPVASQTGTHAAAVTTCQALGNGARVPSVTELLSIVVPFLDTTAFHGWQSSSYAWTSSAIPAAPDSFWAAAVGGGTEAALSTRIERVECVR